MQQFTTSGPYRRNAAQDRRTAWGDDFSGDAWLEPTGVLFWITVGSDPQGVKLTFATCPHCDGTGKMWRFLGESVVDNLICKHCHGTGWTQRARPMRLD